MKIAVQIGATDETADPGRVAQEAESRGFDGIFFPEHTHMPVKQKPMPYAGNEERVLRFRRLFSPFISMAWAASTTKTLKIGTCVSLAAQHDPIVLAKTLASLDVMSNGRVVYGFGFGWLDEEMLDHGVDPKRRRAIVREKMLAVNELWTKDEASFSGEFVRFPACWSWPKPVQRPRPSILLGAKPTDRVFDHVIEYCDGWVPSLHDGLIGNVRRLRERAEQAGRNPATLQVDVIAHDNSFETGELSVAKLEELGSAGVQRVILPLPFGKIDEVRRRLDEHAARCGPLVGGPA
jgi:probable F420-dependent oxidoreductase